MVAHEVEERRAERSVAGRKILIAEDDEVSCTLLTALLKKWDIEPIVARDGRAAWEALVQEGAPRMAILDWMMPELDGPAVCQKIRGNPATRSDYVILLTARDTRQDLILGLKSGADEYIVKPFDRGELRARVEVGLRVLALQTELASRVRELEESMARVKQLQGLLPICSYCKKIRNDSNYWQQVETYIGEHSQAQFSHGICPDCFEKFVIPEIGKAKDHPER